MRKLVLIFIAVVLIAGGLFIFLSSNSETESPQPNTESQSTETDETPQDTEPTSIRIAAMGDMLPHDTVNLRAETSDGYDYTPFFADVAEFIDADIVFCNQESPSAGKDYGITGYPSFNAPFQFARDLSSVGCNLINLANNHIADKGQQAIDATLGVWESLDTLAVAGANRNLAEQDTVRYFTVGDTRFAFIAFTDLSNNRSIGGFGVNMFSDTLVKRLAIEASSNADYVIASAHWGVEDSSSVSSSQRSWATLMAENGVDLIIGTGPHVLQPVEKIGDTVVWYSIGNFLSTQLTLDQLTGGIAYIDIPLDGGEPELSFLPTYMSYTWSASEAAAEDFLARDNLQLVPLDQAGQLIEDSLFDATAESQLAKVTNVLTSSVEVTILNSL